MAVTRTLPLPSTASAAPVPGTRVAHCCSPVASDSDTISTMPPATVAAATTDPGPTTRSTSEAPAVGTLYCHCSSCEDITTACTTVLLWAHTSEQPEENAVSEAHDNDEGSCDTTSPDASRMVVTPLDVNTNVPLTATNPLGDVVA